MIIFGSMTRRTLLRRAALTGLGLAVPWAGLALAQPEKLLPPDIRFRPVRDGKGIVGPFGEVRVIEVSGAEDLPVLVSAIDGSALMDLSGRSALIRYGTGSTAITLTSSGVTFGPAKEALPWNAETVRRLLTELAKDRKKARGAMLLRSALQTSYPVAVARRKSRVNKRLGTAVSKGATGLGIDAFECTTRTVTETVTDTITKVVDIVKSAEQQYQECYDKEVKKLCGAPCAIAICAVKGFFDIVVGTYILVTTVAREVTNEVVTCTIPKPGEWPNPWTIFDGPISGAVSQPKASFGKKEIDDALKLLKDFTGFLGPFAKCLLGGQWSLAQIDTHLNIGGELIIPYGVRVCMDSACASQLSIDNFFLQESAAWGSALSALAALSPEFALAVAPYFIDKNPLLFAAASALPAAVVAAAAIILAFVILALIYGTAVSAQLWFDQRFTDDFADGKVCIEHPTFAIALIKIATLGLAPVELIPPIVTG